MLGRLSLDRQGGMRLAAHSVRGGLCYSGVVMRHGLFQLPRQAEVSFHLAVHGRSRRLLEEQKSHSREC